MDKRTIYVDDELLKCDNLSLCCTKDFDNTFFTNNYSLIDNEEYFEADFKSIKNHEQKFKQQLEDEKKMHELAKAEFDKLLEDYTALEKILAEITLRNIKKPMYNPIQYAVQELEKVKIGLKYVIKRASTKEHDYPQKVVLWNDICDKINQQIKDLRSKL